jgi:hypothetical protein
MAQWTCSSTVVLLASLHGDELLPAPLTGSPQLTHMFASFIVSLAYPGAPLLQLPVLQLALNSCVATHC